MLPSAWQTRLRCSALSPVALLTINPNGPLPTRTSYHRANPWDDKRHLALEPGSVCLATHRDVYITDTKTGRKVPFLPYLRWPTVQRRYAPQDRRAEIGEIPVEVLADAELGPRLDARGRGLSAVARIDLWMPGLALEQVLPLAGGMVSGQIDQPRLNGSVGFAVTDGDPDLAVNYPPGPLTRADFPNLPDWVVTDLAMRQTLVGPGMENMYAIPIDQEGRRFYLVDPPMMWPPMLVQKGKVTVTGWRYFEARAAAGGWKYSGIELDEPIREVASGDQDLEFSGGWGIETQNAIDFLLKQADIPLTPRAERLLPTLTRDFPFSAWFEESEEIQTTVHNLLAQTNYAGTFHRGRFDLLPLLDKSPEVPLSLGRELLFRLGQQSPATDLESVWNAFEIRCGRDVGNNMGLYRVIRDRSNGPTSLRTLCAKSEKLYGRRFLVVEAPDLAVDWPEDADDPTGSPAGERFGDSLVRLHALAHRPHTYKTHWSTGLALDLGFRALVTDANESLDDTKCRVVGLSFPPDGPEVTVQTTDEVT